MDIERSKRVELMREQGSASQSMHGKKDSILEWLKKGPTKGRKESFCFTGIRTSI